MNLKDNLKKIRKDNNLSQEDLAEKLGVSRQSVSKWEQGIAYPEMDKVLQICKMFNLNIDEIMNQDIASIERNKKSKVDVSKYIDDFLSYITKGVNMFVNMTFKQKIKFLFEEAIIIICLLICCAILNEVFEHILYSIFSFLPLGVFTTIKDVFVGLFTAAVVILAIVVFLHILKVRYLDYYVVVDKKEKDDVKEEVKETKEEIKEEKIERKDERIIIRDPKHSGYNFINGVVKVVLFIIKCFAALFGIAFCATFVSLVVALVVSFIFIKTGLFFIGGLLGLIGCIIINAIIIYLIYAFITNFKVNKRLLFVTFIISLILGGVSIGLLLISVKDFNYVDTIDREKMTITTEEMNFDKSMIIGGYYSDVNFIESNNNNIKIEYVSFDYCKTHSFKEGDTINFVTNCDNEFEVFKKVIKDLQNKTFIDPGLEEINIYSTKANIEILKKNQYNYYKQQEENYKNNEIRILQEELEEAYREIDELRSNSCEE